MKRILIAILFSAVFSTTYGQAPAEAVAAENNVVTRSGERSADIMFDRNDPFGNTTMSMINKVVSFQNLPTVKRIDAYVTDANGEMYRNKRLTTLNSSIDLSKVPEGLYYITLLNKDKRKAFMVHL